jgi:hypothetical protein
MVLIGILILNIPYSKSLYKIGCFNRRWGKKQDLINVKHVALNSVHLRSLITMKNIRDIEGLDVAGSKDIL